MERKNNVAILFVPLAMLRYTIFILLLFTGLSCKEEIEDIQDRSELDEDKHTLPEIISFDIPESHLIDFEIDTLSFLALGDSYTIGTGVAERDRWPNQFVDKLRDQKMNAKDAKIVAGAGWTTGNLLKVLDNRSLAAKYDLVSLLIGVNNQYQGALFTTFQKEFVELMKFSLGKSKSRNSIFVLSIPDYGVTPFGGNQSTISEEIDTYNSWIKKTCEANNIKFYDITEISRKAEKDLSLLVSDNLHPSGKMYAEWINMISNQPPDLLNQ